VDDRAFLASLVGQLVRVEAVVQHHGYVEADNRNNVIGISTLEQVLVTTLRGKQPIDHVHIRNGNQLRQYPAGCRIRFYATVRPYARTDGSASWGLSGPHGIELVQAPPALRPAKQEGVSK
jgi:hypothetical protein